MKSAVSQCTRNHWGISAKIDFLDFPGCPVVRNPSSSVGDVGLIPGQRTKISHAMGQLSPYTAMKISSTTSKTPHSQIDKLKNIYLSVCLSIYIYILISAPETLSRQNWWSLGIYIFHQCPEILMGS